MSFDLSRVRFDARKDFLGVIMQQGRVQLDSDWNEWVAQLVRRIQAGTLDTLGRAVVPRETPEGFHILTEGGKLTIGPGRMYVDGLLAESHGGEPDAWEHPLAEEAGTEPLDYDKQPYRPDLTEMSDVPGGPYLAYLDVWQRGVTHLQEPGLVEQAVGVDSTGRLQTVWQVKLLPDVGSITCNTEQKDIPGWLQATRSSDGRLTTSTGGSQTDTGPCDVPPQAGYRGLENQLYRVEIHQGGPLGKATFKWSRDNASVAARVTAILAGNQLEVESVGRDEVLGFDEGDWVEIIDDWRELQNKPGDLRRILPGGVDANTRTIKLHQPLNGDFPVDAQGKTQPERHTRVRRWDQSGMVHKANGDDYQDLNDTAGTGAITVPADGSQLLLENSILVDFDALPGPDGTEGEFRSGDYWVIAARSADASVEPLAKAPPLGIHHHYARLAIIRPGTSRPDDCRKLWPLEQPGTEPRVLIEKVTTRLDPVSSVALSPDGKSLAAISADGTAVLLDAGTGRRLWGTEGEPQRAVLAVAFSPDSVWVADAGSDATIVVREARTGKVISKSVDYAGMILAIAFRPDGRFVAVAGSDATVKVSDPRTGRLVWASSAHTAAVSSIAFSPDGKGLATAGVDGTAALLDANTGKTLWKNESGHNQALLAVAFSPDGGFVAGAGAEATVSAWDAHTGKLIWIWGPVDRSGAVSSIAFSPDGKTLAAISAEGTAVLLDGRTGKPVWSTEGEPQNVVRAVAFTPDSSWIATAGADATVTLREVQTGKVIWKSTEYTGPVSSIASTPDGQRLATASADGIALLLDVRTRERIWIAQIGFRRLGLVENDNTVSCDTLRSGLTIWCSEAVAEEAVNDNPVCSITLNVPYLPARPSETAAPLQTGPVAFLPIVLAAQTKAMNSAIIWIPTREVQEWLKAPPFVDGRLLARLTLKANFVWAANDPQKYIDGDAFGVARGEHTAIRWPTGDGKPGGDFEMWFWVTPHESPKLSVDVRVEDGRILGKVYEAQSGLPVAGAQARLIGTPLQAVADKEGQFALAHVDPGDYQLQVLASGFEPLLKAVTVPGLPVFDPSRHPNLTLEDIPGIGQAFAARLRATGVSHPAQVASTDPARLAETLLVSEAKARAVIEGARALLSR